MNGLMTVEGYGATRRIGTNHVLQNYYVRRSEVNIMKIEKGIFLCCLGSAKMNRPTLASKFEASFAPQPFKI